MLEIQHLSTDFETENGMVYAVRDVSLSVDKGEVLGIVGESGSGKSRMIFSATGLLSGNGIVKDGSITIDGKEISPKAFSNRKGYEQVMDHIRGNDLAMTFWDPMIFSNSVLRIRTQLMEPILNHMDISEEEARKRATELIQKVGVPSPGARMQQYPHQFSGGIRQRIIITIALAYDPKAIIAGEPTTALNVTIQAQVLELTPHLEEKIDSGIIMITHDLGVVANTYDYIAIVYGGEVVETETVFEISEYPQHPHTIDLLFCIPNPSRLERKELHLIPGSPPDLLNIQENCPFADRCTSAAKIYKLHTPQEAQISAIHRCSCRLQHPKTCKSGKVQ